VPGSMRLASAQLLWAVRRPVKPGTNFTYRGPEFFFFCQVAFVVFSPKSFLHWKL
jgi:hypothetical protein